MVRSGLDASTVCFDESVPAAFLDGFSCFWPGSASTLVCFRSADISDITNYKQNYQENFAAREMNYLAAAKRCRASNGDSTNAQPTLFPPQLTFISRFEFGFITGLGRERPPASSIMHGYASTDSKISGGAPRAIEFVYVIVGGAYRRQAAEERVVGNWVVRVDDSTEFEASFNREAQRRGNRVSIDATLYELERRGTTTPTSQSAKLALGGDLQRAIARILEEEGFETMSETRLRAETGMGTKEMLEKIGQRMPFGSRQGAGGKLGPTILILLNQRRPRCTDNGAGAIGAFLMAIQPVPDVASDFGVVGFTVMGVGACSRTAAGSTRTYISGLIEEATREVLTALQRR